MASEPPPAKPTFWSIPLNRDMPKGSYRASWTQANEPPAFAFPIFTAPSVTHQWG